ncbi:hypothetical protein CJO75_23080 (plasmid) [Ralstonia solanacearum]|nr:hypothetical protein CJO75_23080 [Ralstonia solanacearum]
MPDAHPSRHAARPSRSRQTGCATLPSRPNVCACRAPCPARGQQGRIGHPVRRSLPRANRLLRCARYRHPDRGCSDRIRCNGTRNGKRNAWPIPHFVARDSTLKLRYDPPRSEPAKKKPAGRGRAGLTSSAFDDERWSGVLCE